MANMRSWAVMLLVCLAVTHCTESRSTPSDDASLDYNAFSEEAPTNAGNEQMMRDEQDDVQGDEDGEEDDADDVDEKEKVILSTPRTVLVGAGRSVQLPCQVSDSDQTSREVIAWNHGETLLSMGTHSYTNMLVNNARIKVHPNWTLEIKSVTTEDAGTYTCKLMTAVQGPKQSVVHTLKVAAENSPPRIVKLEASNRRVTEGDPLIIQCVAEGYPKPKLNWSRKSPNTDQNTRITTSEGASFEEDSIRIDSVQRSHAGKYFCMAENSVGNPAIQSIDISVVGKPVIRGHRLEENAAIGSTAILECTVHHEPKSTVTWFKDGRELENTGDISIEHRYPTTQLTIKSVKEKDFGVYSCHARNQFGQHHSRISLVQTPVVDPIQVTADSLLWTVTSHSGIEQITIKYRPVDKEQSAWEKQIIRPSATDKQHVFQARFSLSELPPGKYEARAAAHNQYGWARETESVFFEGANEEPNPENIQVAGVGLHVSGATELQSTSFVLATLLACLLTRFI